MVKRLAFILSLVIIGNLSKGQSFFRTPFFCSPGISLGYTFHAKMNYGFVIDFGFIDARNSRNKYGFSFYQYYVRTKKHTHRLRSFSLMFKNDFVDIKLGRGRAKNPWGYSNRNKCIVGGLAFDISLAYPSIYSPWIGYRYFSFSKSNWAWFMTDYNSLYIKYGFDIIQNTNLRSTVTLDKLSN